MQGFNNILVVKYGALGDVVRTSYILPGLCEKYRNPKIYWLTSKASVDLLRFNPYIFEIITEGLNFERIFEVSFDLVISLDDEWDILNNIKKINHSKLTGAFLKDGNAYYTDDSSEWFDMGLISRFGKERADQLKRENVREHNYIFASMLGIEINEPIFYNSLFIEQRATKRFNNGFFNIGINSGAGSRWIAKQLPIEETVALVNKLLSMQIEGKKVCVYLLGGKEEDSRHSRIKDEIISDRLIDAGTYNTILEFAAIIKQCDYVITSDSLALHLAISQKVRNLSFFAPTSAAEIGTFSYGVKIVSLSEDYCSYMKDADNSSITADRIIKQTIDHILGIR